MSKKKNNKGNEGSGSLGGRNDDMDNGGMPEKGSEAWFIMEILLRAEVEILRDKMGVLGVRCERLLVQIESLIVMGEEAFERLSWAEKESWYKEAEELDWELEQNGEILKKLSMEYEVLKVRVNKFYGRDVLRDRDSLFPPITPPGVDNTYGDEPYKDSGGDNSKSDTEEPGEDGKKDPWSQDPDWWK